jgi:hypothetical protein
MWRTKAADPETMPQMTQINALRRGQEGRYIFVAPGDIFAYKSPPIKKVHNMVLVRDNQY